MKNKKHLKKAIIYAAVLAVFLIATNPAIIPFTSKEFKENAGNVWESLFGDVGSIVGLFTINWAAFFKLIAMVLLIIIFSSLSRFIISKINPKTGRGKSALSLVSNGLGYLFVIAGIIWGLSIIGINITVIFTGVGILALVVSFGAESLIEDIITGLFLVFDKQFNVGDIIEIDGFRGTVEQIGVRSTSIRSGNGNVQILNNSSIKKVLNRSMADSVVSCDISISYSADLEKAEKVVEATLPEIRSAYPEIFPTDPVYLGVQELGSSAVILRIAATVPDKYVYTAPRRINREIKLAFDKNCVEIPFPQIVVHQGKD